MSESISIINFGPVKEAKLTDIQKFTIIVGSSGSGKSTIMKILSLFRWLFKMLNIRKYLHEAGFKRSPFRIDIKNCLRDDGLYDYLKKDTFIEYKNDDVILTITGKNAQLIVYGAFAFTIMVWLGMKASLLGGVLVVTLLITPILIRSIDEAARTIPHSLLESSYSLGATRLETIGIVLRQIAPAIATATLLAVGRAIGDAAAVMFTAGFSDNIPTSPMQQTATLPLSIFFQLSAPQTDVQDRAYAAAVVLTIIVLALSLGGRYIMNRFSQK